MKNKSQSKAESDARAPRTETEKVLVEIWSAVLNTSGLGIHDDFLSLGGDSIAAMLCINRISEILGVELPIDMFLLDPIPVSRMASEIDQLRGPLTEIAGK